MEVGKSSHSNLSHTDSCTLTRAPGFSTKRTVLEKTRNCCKQIQQAKCAFSDVIVGN